MNNGSKNGTNGKNGSLFNFPEDLIIPDGADEFSSTASVDNLLPELIIKNENFENEGSSDGSTGYFRKRPARYEHPLWSLGWTDGRLGQPSHTNEELLVARGALRRRIRIQAMQSKLSLNEAKLKDLEAQVARWRALLGEAMTRYTNILNDRAGRFHEFSYALGAFYLFVALLLFISDIPLTLKLVAKGFELKTEVPNPETGKAMFGIDDLLVRTSAVVSQLWEPLCLALGIALAGVFIKIFLDDVIFRDGAEVRLKRKVALSVIGIALLGTIVALGMFRSQVQTNLLQIESQRVRVQREQQMRESGVRDDVIQSSLGQTTLKEESTIEVWTFVLLTVTLPLVAGACFTTGWRRLKDTQRYHQSSREVNRFERGLEKALSSLYATLSELESAKTWLELNTAEPDIDAETQQELNLYRHGYYRGTNVPETIEHGLTLHDRVQRSAQKILAKRLKERMWADAQLRTPGV